MNKFPVWNLGTSKPCWWKARSHPEHDKETSLLVFSHWWLLTSCSQEVEGCRSILSGLCTREKSLLSQYISFNMLQQRDKRAHSGGCSIRKGTCLVSFSVVTLTQKYPVKLHKGQLRDPPLYTHPGWAFSKVLMQNPTNYGKTLNSNFSPILWKSGQKASI